MKKLSVLLLIAALIFAGCQIEEDQFGLLDNTEDAITKKQLKPFKGTLILNQLGPGELADLVASCPNEGFEDPCNTGDDPADPTPFVGSGNLTHLGNTYVESIVWNRTIPGPVPVVGSGFCVEAQCVRLVAANGDELNMILDPENFYQLDFDGNCCVSAVATLDFDGGTGRFEDAQGDATVSINQVLETGVVTAVFNGGISY